MLSQLKKILFISLLISPLAWAEDEQPTTSPSQIAPLRCELKSLPAEERSRIMSELAILLDQVVKFGGPGVAPLIDALVLRASANESFFALLRKYQDKAETLLATKAGSTYISMGFLVEVTDPYHDPKEAPPEDVIDTWLRNGVHQPVPAELVVDRGETKPVIIPLMEGVGIQTTQYKLKERLTPPVHAFLIAALSAMALTPVGEDPDADFEGCAEAMLINWKDLRTITHYFVALISQVVGGHMSLTEGIAKITPSNAGKFTEGFLPRLE